MRSKIPSRCQYTISYIAEEGISHPVVSKFMLQQLHPFGSPFFGSVTPFAVPFFPAPRISGVGVSVIGVERRGIRQSSCTRTNNRGGGLCRVIVQHLARVKNVPEFD
jgi:hypothetical protein